jgi:hypothetical protein
MLPAGKPVSFENDGSADIARQLPGASIELNTQLSRLSLPRFRRGSTQQLIVLLRFAPLEHLEFRAARVVELELFGINHKIAILELAEFLQLRRRERGLHRSPAADHRTPRTAMARCRGARRVSVSLSSSTVAHNARDVGSHVPLADDNRAFVGEIKLAMLVIGMTVVPRDELCRRVVPRDRTGTPGRRSVCAPLADDRVVKRRISSTVMSFPTVTFPKEPDGPPFRSAQ